MTCPHCRCALLADRVGKGVVVPFARGPSCVVFVGRCPHPRCARVVCARVSVEDGDADVGLDVDHAIEPVDDALGWSLLAVASAASTWLWLAGLVVAFTVIPAFGIREAYDSLACGGIAWLFFGGGSLLALVPVIYFTRALAWAAHHALHTAARTRASLRACEPPSLRLVAEAFTYRSH